MGFQGQLSSVNLTDIFQTLHMNRQTGTLAVSGPAGVQHIYFINGELSLCSAKPVEGRAFLISALMRKNLLSQKQADELNRRLYSARQPIRDLILASGYVGEPDLDEVSVWCIEETVCPIFEWQEGDFTFVDGVPVAELTGPDVVTMGHAGLQTTQLLLEATRRNDEWKRISEVITDANALYIVDNEGRANLRSVQTDPEMLKVLRYLDGRHSLDAIASAVGVTRFDTFAITAQLVLAGVARARTAQEIVADVTILRSSGEAEKACELLENVQRTNHVPEVIRPLAEVCAEVSQIPRAVELYLELIQIAQDQGDLQQAKADLDTVLMLSPDDPDLQFDRAKVLSDLGLVEDAAAAYVTAAQAFINIRDTARAIDACHRAKNQLPRSPDPHRFLAKAYLMDGQTENALVEYKSLWHALLTDNRPRRAIEILREILELDCRFNNIKEQVLSHAMNSEAIKTNKAMRILVYAVLLLLLVGAGILAFEYVQTVVLRRQGFEALTALEATVTEREKNIQFYDLFNDINDVRTKYGKFPDVNDSLFNLATKVQKDFEDRAAERVQSARAFLEGGQHNKAIECLQAVKTHFSGSKAAGQVDVIIEQVLQHEIGTQVVAVVDEAKRRWEALEWDEALVELNGVLGHKDLPPAIRTELTALAANWNEQLKSSKDLYERALRLEQKGRKEDALAAFARAGGGDGEQFALKAREHLTALELQFAQELGQQALKAIDQGDDKGAFALLDKLAELTKKASGKGVAEYAARLALPFTIKVDSHQTSLILKRAGGEEQVVRAPDAQRGGWSHRLTYLPTETLTVEARRAGFTPQTIAITYQGRRSQLDLVLKRGPLWQTDLGAIPLTAPVPAGKFVLLCTNKATLEVIDTGMGISRPVVFPATVDEFKAPPIVYQGIAYAIIENTISAVDITTRTRLWTYPSEQTANQPRLTGTLWVQEHELIPGQMLAIMGSAKGVLITISSDNNGRIISYPHTDLGNDITGALLGDQYEANHTILYVPTGNQLSVFDTTSATEHTALTRLYGIRTRGDVVGRLARTTVAGRAAILATDTSGLVLAVDADPAAPENRRAIGSWALDGTCIGGPVCSATPPVAYVAVAEGRVTAIDLARPGQLLWRFPAQGAIAAQIPGAPTIGIRGIYFADGNGTLHCLDAQTGAERWKTDLGSPVTTGILAHEGRIYIPTHGGSLICLEEGED